MTFTQSCDGQLAALAGRDRCYFLTEDLTDEQFRLAAAMCLCSREVRAGRLEGPFTSELAESWAQISWVSPAESGRRAPSHIGREP